MKAVFADTHYLVALTNPHDQHYVRASALDLADEDRIVTHEFVIIELGAILSHPLRRPAMLRCVEFLRTDPAVEIIPATSELIESGLQLFRARPDKGWSLVDCISFVIMKERGITDALTGDRHFQQAGFNALLIE